MLVQFFLWLSFFFSACFIFIDSVLLIGIFGLFFSLAVCYLVRFFFRSWFRAIVVLVYVGGLLVMFRYFLAVCPNEVIGRKWWGFLISIFSPLLIIFLGGYAYFGFSPSFRLTEVDMLYSVSSFPVLLFLVVVLLISLFRVVSIVGIRRGPLRPFSG